MSFLSASPLRAHLYFLRSLVLPLLLSFIFCVRKILNTTPRLFLVSVFFVCQSGVSRAEVYTCEDYSRKFNQGNFKVYVSEFFRAPYWEFSEVERDEWGKLRGHENPYVSLASAFLLIDQGRLLSAYVAIEFSNILFYEKNRLCASVTFREFSMAAKMEILKRISKGSTVEFGVEMIGLIKDSSSNSLVTFSQYRCAIENYDITAEYGFEGCAK
ncbi:hypothetical protein [Thalassospira povalilytica]|uniref:hypothetical protein n=1 Tax=Thalassospira povalilytica TaxID=732237 RepID=UPI003AA95D63